MIKQLFCLLHQFPELLLVIMRLQQLQTHMLTNSCSLCSVRTARDFPFLPASSVTLPALSSFPLHPPPAAKLVSWTKCTEDMPKTRARTSTHLTRWAMAECLNYRELMEKERVVFKAGAALEHERIEDWCEAWEGGKKEGYCRAGQDQMKNSLWE